MRVYHEFYERGALSELPELGVVENLEGNLEVNFMESPQIVDAHFGRKTFSDTLQEAAKSNKVGNKCVQGGTEYFLLRKIWGTFLCFV